MSILDIVIGVLLFAGLLHGFTRGFINQLVSIGGLVVAYILAYQFFRQLSPWLRSIAPIDSLATYKKFHFLLDNLNLETYFYNALAFTLIFFCVRIGLGLAGHFLNIAVRLPGLSFINKWCGAVLALVEVLIIVIIAVNLMSAMPSDKVQKWLGDSKAAGYIMLYSPQITDSLHQLWNSENAI